MQGKDNTLIDDMTKMILRPRRDIYHPDRLGPSQMIVKAKQRSSKSDKNIKTQYVEVTRKDCKVENKGENIQLSYFSPSEQEDKEKKRENSTSNEKNEKSCVIYLHANSGSRVQGLQLVKYVLPFGWSLALFDFRGSGISQGDYTSMGVTQAQDLVQVLSYLNQTFKITEFSLWGRSMGAVTILYYLTTFHNQSKPFNIKAIVLDSPFSDMKKLMHEIGSNTIHLPEFVFTPIISSISDKLSQKIGVDIVTELNLLTKIKKMHQSDPKTLKLIRKIEALFLTSTQDKLVHCSHVQQLHEQFPFEQKELYYYKGQHNDSRSDAVKNKCAQFLCEVRNKGKEKGVEVVSLLESAEEIKKPPPRMSQTINRNQQVQVNSGKDTQFLLPPNQKRPDVNSPRHQKMKIIDFAGKNTPKQEKTTPNSKHQLIKEQQTPLKSENQPRLSHDSTNNQHHQNFSHTPFISHPFPSPSPHPFTLNQHPSQIPHPHLHPSHLPQTPQLHPNSRPDSSHQPTIIINHNYNLSFNIIDPKRSLDLSPDPIPPINFNLPGHMTDRFAQHPIPGSKYYIPQSTKHQKRYDNTSLSNLSNASGDSNLSNSFTFQSSGKSVMMPMNQIAFGRENQFNHSQQLPNSCGKIQIPLLKFEGLDYDTKREEENSSSGFKRPEKIERLKGKDVIGSPVCGQRQKLSLVEMRKMQKEEHQHCVMKSSKIISYKDRHSDFSDDFEKLNLKKEIRYEEDSWMNKTQENQKNKMRSMKTSLMAKRKPGDRKSSDSVSGTIKSFIEKKTGAPPPENSLGSLFTMGKPMINSPKGQPSK